METLKLFLECSLLYNAASPLPGGPHGGSPGGVTGQPGQACPHGQGALAARASHSPGRGCGHACMSESPWGGAEVATTKHRTARPRLPPRLSPRGPRTRSQPTPRGATVQPGGRAGRYLAGVHVRGQLEAPAPVAVAGVAPRGVDAGLLAAPLRTLVHICQPQGSA